MPNDADQTRSPAVSPTGSYSYAVIRLVPRVEREEFINVGVVLFARERRFLAARIGLDHGRVRALAPALDLKAVERHLQTFQAVAEGAVAGGPVANLPQPERFYWLTAPRSTVIQTSPVHTGVCADPAACLDDLFTALVEAPAP